MVRKITQTGENLYQCEACGLFYKEEELAKRCQAWCAEHKSCNLDIIKQAVKKNN
ncbi:MAG TPA: hypothetical protein VGA49_01400 [Patescibacteria group bacterium]